MFIYPVYRSFGSPLMRLLLAETARLLIVGSYGGRNRNALSNVGRQESRLSGPRIQANSGQKRARGNLLGLVIDHFVCEEKDLLAHLLKPGANGDAIAGQQLALVFDALLYRHHTNVLGA